MSTTEYIDIVTYSPDTTALQAELKTYYEANPENEFVFPDIDLEEEITEDTTYSLVLGQSDHMIKKDGKSVALDRSTALQVDFVVNNLTNLEIIGYDRGNTEFEFVDATAETKYESVYPTAPYDVDETDIDGNPTGNTITVTPPKRFVTFRSS